MKKVLSICLAMIIIFLSIPHSDVFAEQNNEISIAMATDNNYTYPTIVSMTSILENKNTDTKIDFYIMLSGDFPDESKAKILNLQNKYANCNVTLIDMKDKFKDLYTSRWLTSATYYRLVLASLLPNLSKILYLDTDIIVKNDLCELFNLNIENYYVAGTLDIYNRDNYNIDFLAKKHGQNSYAKFLNIPSMNQYINAGILLMNLNKIRNDNVEQKFLETAKTNNFEFHDQDVINSVCYNNIYPLHLKYNTLGGYIENLNTDTYYLREKLDAIDNPVIIHFPGDKPWNNPADERLFFDLWWKYAEKTDYFKEIQAKYLLPNGKYTIESALNKNKVLDIDRASHNDFANLHLWAKNDGNNQKFLIKYNTEGYYTIKSLCSNKMLDVIGGSQDLGCNIAQYSRNNSDTQKWYILPCGDGYYHIVSKCNGLFMDVENAHTHNGTNIRCWNRNDSNAQKFKFVKQ